MRKGAATGVLLRFQYCRRALYHGSTVVHWLTHGVVFPTSINSRVLSVEPFQTTVHKPRCSVEINQFALLLCWIKKYTSAVCSRTQKGGVSGRHSSARRWWLFVEIHRLTCRPWSEKWTVGAPEKKRLSQRNCWKSTFSSIGETHQPSINLRAN